MSRMLLKGTTALEYLEGIMGISLLVYSVLLFLEFHGWYHMWGAYKTIILFYNPRIILVTILLTLVIGILNMMVSYGFRVREKWALTALILSLFESGVILYLSPEWMGIYIPTNELMHFFDQSLLSFHPMILGLVVVANAFLLLYILRTNWLRF